jgi:hypothetical protein
VKFARLPSKSDLAAEESASGKNPVATKQDGGASAAEKASSTTASTSSAPAPASSSGAGAVSPTATRARRILKVSAKAASPPPDPDLAFMKKPGSDKVGFEDAAEEDESESSESSEDEGNAAARPTTTDLKLPKVCLYRRSQLCQYAN